MSEFYKTLINPKGKFGIWGILFMVLLGIALMLTPALFLGNQSSTLELPPQVIGQEKSNSGYSLGQLESSISQQISQILGQVDGAGMVSVSVSIESGPQQDYAQNVTEDSKIVEERDSGGGTRITTDRNSKAQYVFSQNQSEPLVLKEVAPKINGILVVAEGAGDGEIKAKLSKAVQSLLNLPAHRVMVLPKESR